MSTNKNWMTLERAREIVAQIEVMRGSIAHLKETMDTLAESERVTKGAARELKTNNDRWDMLGNQLLDCLESVAATCVDLLEDKKRRRAFEGHVIKAWSE